MTDARREPEARRGRPARQPHTAVDDVRVMQADDIPAALRLTRASHWNQLERDWELFLTLSPGGCRVAIAESGDVVGSVATIRYGSAFGWIAMVLVDPAYRGQGIGSKLLGAALDILGDIATVRLDATPAGYGVYSRCGFVDECTVHRMQRLAQPLPDLSAGLHPQHRLDDGPTVRRMQARDLADVLVQDREVFGADRGTLLESFHDQAPEYAWMCGEGHVDGYLFGRRGHSFEHLGPLVARDESTARRLLGACLASSADRPFIVDVPVRPWMTEYLETLQFTLQRPFARMFRGQPYGHGRADRQYAIAGPEFG